MASKCERVSPSAWTRARVLSSSSRVFLYIHIIQLKRLRLSFSRFRVRVKTARNRADSTLCASAQSILRNSETNPRRLTNHSPTCFERGSLFILEYEMEYSRECKKYNRVYNPIRGIAIFSFINESKIPHNRAFSRHSENILFAADFIPVAQLGNVDRTRAMLNEFCSQTLRREGYWQDLILKGWRIHTTQPQPH